MKTQLSLRPAISIFNATKRCLFNLFVFSCALWLAPCFLSSAQCPLILTSTDPSQAANNISRSASIVLNFDDNINNATLNSASVVITGSQTGIISGTFSGGGTSTIIFDPAADFKPGEVINVTITSALQDVSGCSLAASYQFEFRTASNVIYNAGSAYSIHTITATASNISFLYAADMDGDGDLDVINASNSGYYRKKIEWHENTGSQSFTAHTIVDSSNNNAIDISALYAADLDGDGDMDVLTASRFEDKIEWQENEGGQNFTTHTISAIADGAISVYAADVDGDGDLDVLSASQNDDKIAWYENDGNRNFNAHIITTLADGANSVYATDVDGDGDMDVLSASQYDDEIAWYKNDGSQNFIQMIITNTLYFASIVYAADMDGDGDIDVLSASYNNIAWYENNNQVFAPHTISNGGGSVYAADMDGDGDLDVLSTASNNGIAWYENDNNGNFTARFIQSSPLDGLSPSFCTADMDGDGDQDVVSGTPSSGIYFNDSKIIWYEFVSFCSSLTSTVPAHASNNVSRSANIVLNFADNVNIATANSSSIVITGSQTGGIAGAFSGGGASVTFDPAADFKPGEVISVTITPGVENNSGCSLIANHQFEFRTATASIATIGASYNTHVITTVADSASIVYAADVDGDGDMDALSASMKDKKIAWYENDGSQSFTPHTIATVIRQATALCAADMDSDGDLDVISTYDYYKLAWYENDGAWNFTTHLITTGAYGIISLHVADLDNDGDMDILGGSEYASTRGVEWYENDNLVFVPHIVRYNFDGNRSVHAADVTGDGNLDLLAASYNEDMLLLFENDGLRNFKTDTLVDAYYGINSVYAVDMDNDGDLDILWGDAAASYYEPYIIAWIENNNGVFTYYNLITATAQYSRSVYAADVDGDGDMDVLSASQYDDKIAWYENDGSQAFTARTITTAADGAISVYAADMDSDGDMDVLSASPYDDKIAWYEIVPAQPVPPVFQVTSTVPAHAENDVNRAANVVINFNANINLADAIIITRGSQTGDVTGAFFGDGTSSITFNPDVDFNPGEVITVTITMDMTDTSGCLPFSTYCFEFRTAADDIITAGLVFTKHLIDTNAISARSVFAADVDGDGDMDALSASLWDNRIAWYENDGSQNFVTHTIASFYAFGVHAADLDGDGDMDVLGSSNGGHLEWYENDGSQNFTTHVLASTLSLSYVYAGDVDGDGDMDVLGAGSSGAPGNLIAWFENDGNRNFTERVITNDANNPTSVYATDLDGDGDVDVLSSSSYDSKIAWYENRGCLNFIAHTIPAPLGSYPYSVYAADVDDDGDLDVLCALQNTDKFEWYENDGSQNFTAHTIAIADYARWVYAADIDGDGDMDALGTSTGDRMSWYENDGSQNFTAHIIEPLGAFSSYAADMDGDGDLDALSASGGPNTIAWYELVNPGIRVEGHVFNDTNGNGIEDGGETGLPGVTVIANPQAYMSVTDSNGNYVIYVDDLDTFTVGVSVPSRYYCTGSVLLSDTLTAPPGVTHNVILSIADSVSANNDFGLKPAVTQCGFISGQVFQDVNGNGIKDSIEAGVPGITVALNSGSVTSVTDQNGDYSINVGMDTFTVKVIPPQKFYCSFTTRLPDSVTVPAGNLYTIIISPADSVSSDNDFGLQRPPLPCGNIRGHVFKDTNSNGIKDNGEPGLSGITVRANPGLFSDITDQNGNYSINVGIDTFMVGIVLPSRYYCSGTAYLPDSVTMPAGNIFSIITTPVDTVSIDNNFGLSTPSLPCGVISGYVWNDLNGNGTDDGEPRRGGIFVGLSNGQSAVTDFNGMYSIEIPFNTPVTVSIAPSPGSYFCGGVQPYFLQTFPPFNGTYSVSLTGGSPNSFGNDFGVEISSGSYDVSIAAIRCFSSISKGTFTAWMDFKSIGENIDTCKLRLTFDPLVDFISASIQPTSVTSTYIEWAFPPGTTPDWYCMEMEFFLDGSVGAGTNLVWTGTYYCGSPDGCPGNDTLTVMQTVIFGNPRQSYDNGFNFMEVEHTGNPSGDITLADSVFSYCIMFQNTGTDTVYHLTIVDTLPPYLNIQTISYPFSSNSFKLHIPSPNILIWEFNNILLPDSATDFHHSYGFIQYNIHMKPNLPQGTEIENRATTIFNYINPYQTNSTSLRIYEPLSFSTSVTDVTCFEGNDGAIDLVVNGGTAPYDFTWSNGATTEDLLNVTAGNYSVIIEDADNLVTTASATIAEGFDVDAGSITGLDSVGINQTTFFNVTQVSGYTYTWSITNGSIIFGQGTNSVEVDFDSPGQGTLTVVVSAQGCSETVSKNVILTDPTGISNLADGVVKIYPNPGSGVFKVVLPENISTESHVKVYDVLGTLVLEKALSENSTRVIELNLGVQTDGLYFVRIETGEKSWRGKVMLMK